MRRIVPVLLLIAFGLFGCSTHGGRLSESEREAFEAKLARYDKLASESPPDSWRTGAHWEFMAFDKNDAVAESFVFRVTDAPQEACLSGDWKKLEIVSGERTKLRNPAYSLEGRNLSILLSTALCDAYPMYLGELSDNGFIGTHEFSHLLGRQEFGKVSGKPVQVSP